MGKAAKTKFYAIRRGYKTGIFTTPWEETKKLIEGFNGAIFKGFKSLKEAEAFMKTSRVKSNASASPNVIAKSQQTALTTDEMEKEPLIVYTDGSCLRNGHSEAKAGYGVYFGSNDSRNECNRVSGPQTNNRGELFGVIRALELTRDCQEMVVIRSDSQYVRNGVQTWMHKWKQNGWKRSTGELLNVDFWQTLDLLYTERARKGLVKIEYIKAHAGIEGNEAADKLANTGALMPI